MFIFLVKVNESKLIILIRGKLMLLILTINNKIHVFYLMKTNTPITINPHLSRHNGADEYPLVPYGRQNLPIRKDVSNIYQPQ